MNNDKISVIIPTNNPNNLNSIIKNLSSKKIDYEIIFIGPFKVNKRKVKKKVKFIESYLKPTHCLQLGLFYSTGNYLIQMADDCLLKGHNDPLYYLYKKTKSNPKKLISCKYSVNGVPSKNYEYNYLPWDDSTNLPIAPLMKKKDIIRVGGYDKTFIAVLSDIDLYLRLRQSCKLDFYYSKIFVDENKKHNKSNNLLPTYWNHDRNNLDKFWVKNKKKPYLSKKRNEIIQKFDNSPKLINKPQGNLGKWLYNNKYYFKFIDNRFSKILFFIIGITNNTRRYYINSILKKFKMI
ncbi:hypothetical protein [Candidatus Pelagibacter sp.]|uniref:hypothetical protein n=1 Tax=Candidatus Pelagibacter sp. TaxID=2024849 RepID=UPI003F842D87